MIVRGKVSAGVKRKLGEMYSEARFFAMTGDIYGEPRPINENQAALDALWQELQEMKDQKDVQFQGQATAPFLPPSDLPADDNELLETLFSIKPQLVHLYRGNISGHDSPSEADLALCNHLAWITGKDSSRIDRIFRGSGLMRPKWDERHAADGRIYGQIVIDKATKDADNTKERERSADVPDEQNDPGSGEKAQGQRPKIVVARTMPENICDRLRERVPALRGGLRRPQPARAVYKAVASRNRPPSPPLWPGIPPCLFT